MLELLKKKLNVAYTENLARAFSTTGSDVLDFFASAGAMRTRAEKDIVEKFSKAFYEDRLLALKALFYIRDVRGGQGERRAFRAVLRYLASFHPDVLRKNLHLVPEYGRWDDLWVLFRTSLEKDVMQLVQSQLKNDTSGKTISLLAKWLPSENASSKKSRENAKLVASYLGWSMKNYRKTLSALRKKIDVVEVKMSKQQWEEINYERVPSKASLLYRKAFMRHDRARYEKFISLVKSGQAKINTETLYPYEIVRRFLLYKDKDDTLEVLWRKLPNYCKPENALVVCDTSGSMTSNHFLPLSIAVSLALYTAERNTGPFHNHFITFSTQPRMQRVIGDTLYEKVMNLKRSEWGFNTNIEAVFDTILFVAIENRLTQEEMVKKVYIISDMEFDVATGGKNDQTLFETIEAKYKAHGYNLPLLVFWCVDSRNDQFPMTLDKSGVILVSGASPRVYEYILKDEIKTPYEMMLDVLNSPRYNKIVV